MDTQIGGMALLAALIQIDSGVAFAAPAAAAAA
jgi:hypothetical protein